MSAGETSPTSPSPCCRATCPSAFAGCGGAATALHTHSLCSLLCLRWAGCHVGPALCGSCGGVHLGVGSSCQTPGPGGPLVLQMLDCIMCVSAMCPDPLT